MIAMRLQIMLSLEESLIYTPEPNSLLTVPMNPMIFPDTLGINFIYHNYSHIIKVHIIFHMMNSMMNYYWSSDKFLPANNPSCLNIKSCLLGARNGLLTLSSQ